MGVAAKILPAGLEDPRVIDVARTLGMGVSVLRQAPGSTSIPRVSCIASMALSSARLSGTTLRTQQHLHEAEI
jgi:hypothetical protein